jgi:hypothetical protein
MTARVIPAAISSRALKAALASPHRSVASEQRTRFGGGRDLRE